MQRFYLPKENFSGDYIVSKDTNFIKQISRVLRAKEGEHFLIFDNSRFEYLAQLIELDSRWAKFLIIDKKAGKREPEKNIILYQSLLKSDKFEILLQKAVEIGAAKIAPIISQNCVARSISPAKQKRFKTIIKEATEQCGGCRLPEFLPRMDFGDAVKTAQMKGGIKLIAWESEENCFLADMDLAEKKEFHIFVGPEGGFDTKEIELAKKAGILPISLGKRILRAETAGIFLLSALMAK